MTFLEITAADASLYAGALVLVIGAISAAAVAIIKAVKDTSTADNAAEGLDAGCWTC